MFTNRYIRKLILPLVIEQLLVVMMGICDTIMVASGGEAAVSGVSIVDSISMLLIGIMTALASGGAVVTAQYVGKGDRDKVGRASNQLFLSVGGIAVLVTGITLLFNSQILHLIYGDINTEVMDNARKYFYLNAISYPFLGIFQSGAALLRAVGNSKISMRSSLIANILHIAGNALLIYVFHLGVVGAGISTLFSRSLSSLLICLAIRKKGDVLPISSRFYLDHTMLRRILSIGVPNGLENGMFQFGKLMLTSLISTFGVTVITSYAVAGSIASFQNIASSAIGMVIITVVGQCVGAGELEQARKYLFKLLRMAYFYVILIGTILMFLANPICSLYHLSSDTMDLTRKLILYGCGACMPFLPLSFSLPNGLRAANDVRYTMLVSIASMWICRILFAYILVQGFGLGIFGIWYAMTIDWGVRSIFFLGRVLTGRWLKHVHVENN